MVRFEYKAVAAPTRGTKARGVKTTEDRFALSITNALNEHAADGWEFVRVETLPCESRRGLTGTQLTDQSMLVFRRIKRAAESLDATDAVLPTLTLASSTSNSARPSRIDPPISRSTDSEPNS